MSKRYSKKIRKQGNEKNRRPTPEKHFSLMTLKPNGLPAKITYDFGPKLTLLPKAAPKPQVAKVKRPTKRLHGGRMAKDYHRPQVKRPQPVIKLTVITPILSDTEWCAGVPFEFETGLLYGPLMPTHKQLREMKRAAKQSIRLEAGVTLKQAEAKTAAKRGIHSENLPNRHERPGETVKARAIEMFNAGQRATTA